MKLVKDEDDNSPLREMLKIIDPCCNAIAEVSWRGAQIIPDAQGKFGYGVFEGYINGCVDILNSETPSANNEDPRNEYLKRLRAALIPFQRQLKAKIRNNKRKNSPPSN